MIATAVFRSSSRGAACRRRLVPLSQPASSLTSRCPRGPTIVPLPTRRHPYSKSTTTTTTTRPSVGQTRHKTQQQPSQISMPRKVRCSSQVSRLEPTSLNLPFSSKFKTILREDNRRHKKQVPKAKPEGPSSKTSHQTQTRPRRPLRWQLGRLLRVVSRQRALATSSSWTLC